MGIEYLQTSTLKSGKHIVHDFCVGYFSLGAVLRIVMDCNQILPKFSTIHEVSIIALVNLS